MSSDPNFGFVIAAYAIGFVVVGAMIAWTLLDYRRLKRALSRFPERGEREVSQVVSTERKSRT
ncbi:heme exporter protein CcmD [Methylocapsa acidiphila]|uniref:heme exporter protein CcmD n=1 Tax=Methylocapsa acidiphila TaxID=133552 RepID=UPI000404398D|nr:heme exporter protein CcmD [Methylocapsa acidiphila]